MNDVAIIVAILFWLWALTVVAKPRRILNLKFKIPEPPMAAPESGTGQHGPEGTLDRLTSKQRKDAIRRLRPYSQTLAGEERRGREN
jgi:hypothetical protein